MMSSRWIVVLGALLAGAGCQSAPAASVERGDYLFANYCAPCHGPTGKGMDNLGAPAIAGLPEWYVTEQLHKFRGGLRGAHVDDVEGLRMRPMSRTLAVEEDIGAVAKYISSLAASRPEATLQGDAAKGAVAYGTCAACHGPQGAGNEQLGAPPLTLQQDWYLVRQLGKFKSGVRGANPKDVRGGQMRPMAATLADEKAVMDVVSHIQTLGR